MNTLRWHSTQGEVIQAFSQIKPWKHPENQLSDHISCTRKAYPQAKNGGSGISLNHNILCLGNPG